MKNANQRNRQRSSRLTTAVLAALTFSLAACGGGSGGGNVRPTPPPPAPPGTPPVVYPADPAFSKHLAVTNTAQAHAAGFTGQGIRIGVVDTGVKRTHPALSGRVVENLVYIDSPPNNLSVDDVAGHGTAVSQVIAGRPFGAWPGGIAPDAQIVSARIISDNPPPDDGSGQGNEIDGALGLKPIHQDLINRGVKIMNNSWGGVYWTNPAATAAIADEYRPFVINNGGIVVFATGNESEANPSSIAALPNQLGSGGSLPAADLERGWLAVGAVTADNPSQLASYSNACGVAMNYCLVAPGDVIVTGTNDGAQVPTYFRWTGTSLAAPQVTGAAALVWQAFPYFSNDLVRQTILGSATDLGAAGVDPVFGYGLLNVGKAVQGPSKLNWGDVRASFDSITSTWSNAISGAGGLIKEGTGTLVLSATNSYAGPTQVTGGTLRVNGSNQSAFSIGPQGNLAGTGTVRNLENNGTVTVEGASNLSVTQNYHQTASATLALDLGNWLNVSGSAQLDGGTLRVIGIKNGYVTHSRETVLLASGGLTGQFAQLTQGPGVFLTATPGYDATTAWLDISSISVTAAAQAFGASSASLSSAQRVEAAMDTIDAQMAGSASAPGAVSGNFIAAAADFQRAPTAQAAEASLKSLSGELHATADAMTYESIDASRRALSSRFDDLGERPLLGGMWQRNLEQSGGMARSGFSGFDYDLSGQMTGLDMRLGQNGVLGLAASHTQGAGWLDRGNDRSRSRQDEGQIYAGLVGDNAYLQGRVGFGRFERKVDRRILLGTRETGAATSYSGDYDVAHAETGWRMRWGQSRITPYFASQYARIRNDGFSEAGADGFGLRTRANSSQRWQAIAGLRADRQWRFANDMWLGLEAHAEWQRTLSANGGLFDASFVGLDQWQTLAGIGLADQSRLFGLGMNFGLSDRATLNFDISHRYAPNLQDNQVSMQYALGF